MIRLAATSRDTAPPDIWQALADPTRRRLIDLLAQNPATTGQLCEGFSMSRFGVMKHLAVLEDAGLVTSRKRGRVRTNHFNSAPLIALTDGWLAPRAKQLTRGILAFAETFEPRSIAMSDSAATVEVALDWTIDAAPRQVWEALFSQPDSWWPAEHRAAGEGSTMHLEPRLGAMLEERSTTGGGIAWYTIYALDLYRSVDLRGDLARRYGGPATSLLHFSITEGERDGTTLLKLTDSLTGKVDADLQRSTAEGWQQIIGNGLVRSLQ